MILLISANKIVYGAAEHVGKFCDCLYIWVRTVIPVVKVTVFGHGDVVMGTGVVMVVMGTGVLTTINQLKRRGEISAAFPMFGKVRFDNPRRLMVYKKYIMESGVLKYTYNLIYFAGGNFLGTTVNGTATKTLTYGDAVYKDRLTDYGQGWSGGRGC